MRWNEVRELFPNRWMLLKMLSWRREADGIHVEDMAVIRPLTDGKEATQAMRECGDGVFIYHTGQNEVIIPIHRVAGALRVAK